MITNKTFLALAVTLSSTATFAQTSSSDLERINQAEQRIQYLEQRMQDQKKAISSKQNIDHVWVDSITIGGAIEVEASFTDPNGANRSSDIVVATAELAISADISNELSGEIVLLHEEDDTDFEVDTAIIYYAIADTDWTLTAGQTTTAFGAYESGLLSDPLTLELGETGETVLSLNYDNGAVTSSIYTFNGTNNKDGDNVIGNFGASIGYANESFSFNAGYINDLGESDTIEGALTTNNTSSYVGGVTIAGSANYGNLTFIYEIVEAIDDFDTATLADKRPKAQNIEVDYAFTLSGKPATFAIASQSTDDANTIGLAESKQLIGLNIETSENFSFGVEFSKQEDYAGMETNNFVAQLALNF